MWTYAFDARRAVADNQPVYVVKAMSELLDAELVKAFQDMDQKLSSHSISSNRSAKLDNNTTESAQPDPTEQNSKPAEATVDMPSATLKNKK